MSLLRRTLGPIADSARVHNIFSRPGFSRLALPILRPLVRMGPLARRIPLTLLFAMPVTRQFEVSLENGRGAFRLQVDPDDFISKSLFWYGLRGYEPLTVRLLSMLAESSSTFLDVGANTGVYSLVVAATRPEILVHAIEPVPSVFDRLQRNADLNGFQNLVLHQVAISDTIGHAEIHVPVGAVPLESSLRPGHRPNTDAVTVEVTTIDNLVAKAGNPRVDLMKVDTEGTTRMVIEGAKRTLSRDRPFLACEILHGVTTDTSAWPLLKELGYHSFLLTSAGLRADEEVKGDPRFRELNYLFVHRDRLGQIPPTWHAHL